MHDINENNRSNVIVMHRENVIVRRCMQLLVVLAVDKPSAVIHVALLEASLHGGRRPG